MGKLSFLNLEVTPLGMRAAFVLGEWHLSRESEDPGGIFTPVFRRIGEQWVIVHDHTSRAETVAASTEIRQAPPAGTGTLKTGPLNHVRITPCMSRVRIRTYFDIVRMQLPPGSTVDGI
jgi:hypothetical protein